MAEELFADYAPTPGYAARLKATAAQQATAPQLVALAEQVCAAYSDYLDRSTDFSSYQPDEESEAMRQELRRDLGFDKPYTPVNDCGVWRALVWLELGQEQWRMMVDFWQGSQDLNPNAMNGMFGGRMPHNNAPVAMLCIRHKGYDLVLLQPPCRPEVDLQIGEGILSDETVATFNSMVESRCVAADKNGWPPYRRPALALIYGVPYYYDRCQWSSGEMDLSPRDANARIFVQTLCEHAGHYVLLK